ncbi:hypothetical protein POTOM_017901 [Populus tomentosa]|uniref:Uncharacterized protein n=1 Tax=Populus tomentosa TaxID=118781 RepID=A0A8X8CW53_POPTO|nr:hypothetical protein POTOM_017901 [Populus tomentosa]
MKDNYENNVFWTGNCRKVIRARFYFKGFEADNGPLEEIGGSFFLSARDTDDHGSIVPNVSLFGMARGTARGGALYARLAIYKACWLNLCSDADGLSLNYLKMETSYGLIAGGDAAAPGVPAKTYY